MAQILARTIIKESIDKQIKAMKHAVEHDQESIPDHLRTISILGKDYTELVEDVIHSDMICWYMIKMFEHGVSHLSELQMMKMQMQIEATLSDSDMAGRMQDIIKQVPCPFEPMLMMLCWGYMIAQARHMDPVMQNLAEQISNIVPIDTETTGDYFTDLEKKAQEFVASKLNEPKPKAKKSTPRKKKTN